MGVISWIVLGLIAGFLASKVVYNTGSGFLMDVALGVIGAVVGGWLFSAIGGRGVSGLDISSIIVATVGAIIVIFLYHALFGNA